MGKTFKARAVSVKRILFRPVIATRDPLEASASAMARPMPLDPPVIKADAFRSSMSPPQIDLSFQNIEC
jgi:hypothetical protein